MDSSGARPIEILKSILSAGFEDIELIDLFEQTIELFDFFVGELVLGVAGKEIAEFSLFGGGDR